MIVTNISNTIYIEYSGNTAVIEWIKLIIYFIITIMGLYFAYNYKNTKIGLKCFGCFNLEYSGVTDRSNNTLKRRNSSPPSISMKNKTRSYILDYNIKYNDVTEHSSDNTIYDT